jgi:hypothetical protein
MALTEKTFIELYIKVARRHFELDYKKMTDQRIIDLSKILGISQEEVRKLWDDAMPNLLRESEERYHNS